MDVCFGDENGSPRIAQYKYYEPYIIKVWETFLKEERKWPIHSINYTK